MDSIAKVDGSITINNLTLDEINALQDKVVWEYSDRRSPQAIVRFGGTHFRPKKESESITFDTGSPQYDFELKAILILMLHAGNKQGGDPYKWSTTNVRAHTLIRFATYCLQRGKRSFRDMETMPDVKLKTLMVGFILDDDSRGGMDALVNTSNFQGARDALQHLSGYGLVPRPDFMELMDELTLKPIEKHQSEHRLKHSIIPTGVMKHLIGEAVAYVDRAEKKFDKLAKIFRHTHNAIIGKKCTRPQDAIWLKQPKTAEQLGNILDKHFSHLQRHTYALTLAFTGMRDDEAGELETDCSGCRTENGESIYFIKSWLSKTAENPIYLDWVANETAFRAVRLLSKLNNLYYERANLILEHYHDILTSQKINELKHGLQERKLFGIILTIRNATFRKNTKGRSTHSTMSPKKYRILVEEADIAQLEQMECNYKSVSPRSGYRGKPFNVGDYFNFTAHQFRHTFAWFIIANRLGDIDDIKYQFKHLKSSMTLIYAERGFKSLMELETIIEGFEVFLSGKSYTNIVESAMSGQIAGGGGEHLAQLLREMNRGEDNEIYTSGHQPHFKNTKELVAYITRFSDSLRGLPHGYCTKGPNCKIRNAADPSLCINCDTYYAIPKHLPYWRAIKANCETGLSKIAGLPAEAQENFKSFKQNLDDNLFAAKKVIIRLTLGIPAPGEVV
jgi:hypothetical protein